MTWYGRGPAETYIDRAFERVGVYTSTVSAEWVEYSRPQENGNKTDVRWVALTNDKGDRPASRGRCRCWASERHHASQREIEQAAYTYQIPSAREVYLNLDLAQMGVGGIDSWSPQRVPDGALPDSGRQAVLVLVPVAAD